MQKSCVLLPSSEGNSEVKKTKPSNVTFAFGQGFQRNLLFFANGFQKATANFKLKYMLFKICFYS